MTDARQLTAYSIISLAEMAAESSEMSFSDCIAALVYCFAGARDLDGFIAEFIETAAAAKKAKE